MKTAVKIEWFQCRYYHNDQECTRCKKALEVKGNFGRVLTYLGEDTDEEGYRWQAYCNTCAKKLKNSNAEDVYRKYQ